MRQKSMPEKEPATQVVKDIRRATRRHLPSQSRKQRAHMFYDQDKAEVGRLLGLDIVDWSMLLVAIGLTALIVVLA
jgi:hypothetical protein